MPIRPAIRRRKLRPAFTTAWRARQARRIRRKVIGRTVHTFTEKAQLASIGCPAGSTVTGTQTYKVSDLVNWNSFEALFDLYKLKAVKLTLVPLASQSDANNGYPNSAGQIGSLPMLYIAPNRDPYVPQPGSVADVLNDDGSKIIRLSKPVSFYLKSPKPDILDRDGTQVPIQTNVGKDFWLTTGGNLQGIDQSSVKHFGHRYVLVNNGAQELVVYVYIKYYFMMKEQD